MVMDPAGVTYRATVDEHNRWTVEDQDPTRPEELALLASEFVSIVPAGPSQPDEDSRWAQAVVEALPGSRLLTALKESPHPPGTVY